MGELFTELFLMTLATIGVYTIGEYPEGVAVMLFYAVGEWFQMEAVKKAENSITTLLDVRSNSTFVLRSGKYEQVDPENVSVGEKI